MDAVQTQMEVLSVEIERLGEIIENIEKAVEASKVDLQATKIIRDSLVTVLGSYSTTAPLELGLDVEETAQE
ncbi:MAG: hypothetical protein CL605_10140 [Altibacter sp.]|uniref:hypothetical protein n=1 Tax=Altibacter sp. TaxID=2024823 RepID=UPI000C91DB02|nr:hypothetical protein [Altibacter sp.]MAP55252.1 hypothetical protein [Altibacter sp.]|tara:strand:- start:13426 stop:13641 length:216 start_codon:yes stop_codon:yes gene_type:complete